MVVCKKCGSQFPNNINLCPVCNTPIDSETNSASSDGQNQNIQPTYYKSNHEFMEDTFLEKMRKRAKTKPFSTYLLIIFSCVLLMILIIIAAALIDVTDGKAFPVIWIAISLLYTIFYAPKLRKKRRKYTQPVTATIINYRTIKTHYKMRVHKHYYPLYQYEFNGLYVISMSDDEYGSIPKIGTQAQLLIQPDKPDKLYEPELETERIISSIVMGLIFVAFGVFLLLFIF